MLTEQEVHQMIGTSDTIKHGRRTKCGQLFPVGPQVTAWSSLVTCPDCLPRTVVNPLP